MGWFLTSQERVLIIILVRNLQIALRGWTRQAGKGGQAGAALLPKGVEIGYFGCSHRWLGQFRH